MLDRYLARIAMADDVADRRNGSAGAGTTVRAEVARAVFEAWGDG